MLKKMSHKVLRTDLPDKLCRSILRAMVEERQFGLEFKIEESSFYSENSGLESEDPLLVNNFPQVV